MEADRARGLHLPQGAQERFETAGRFLHVAGAGGAVGQAVHRLHADAEQQVDRRAALGQGKQLRRCERPQVGLREAVAGDGREGEGGAGGVLHSAGQRRVIARIGVRVGVQPGLARALQGVAGDELGRGNEGRHVGVAEPDHVEQHLPL
jgi:hypothetical protein